MKVEFTGHVFSCPKCGGSMYSSHLSEGSVVRTCSGRNDDHGYAPCGFQWPDSDDWKYSKFGIFGIPENRFEHMLLENAGAGIPKDEMDTIASEIALIVEKYSRKT